MEERQEPRLIAELDDGGRAMQILTTEHWSLLATRSLNWNESFARSGLYLTVLSASVVALALVAQATAFDDRFVMFALVLLPVVFFIGAATIVRVGESSAEDARWVAGMNRIRNAYLELEPGLERYFVTSHYDDERGLLATFGAPPTARWRLVHMLVTTPGMLAVVNAVVSSVAIAIAVHSLGGSTPWAAAAGVVAFIPVLALLGLLGARELLGLRSSLKTQFPSPPEVAD